MSATEAAGADVRVRTARVPVGRTAAGRTAGAGLAPVVPLPRAVSGPPSAPPPLRLTRRGRLVLAAVALVLAMVVVVLVAPSAAGMSGHQPARAGYQHMRQIVVRPGQSLWSIAAAADPAADPRIVVQQIIEANALGGASIRAGQLLWVPTS